MHSLPLTAWQHKVLWPRTRFALTRWTCITTETPGPWHCTDQEENQVLERQWAWPNVKKFHLKLKDFIDTICPQHPPTSIHLNLCPKDVLLPPSLRQVHHRFVEETKTNRLVEVAIAKWQSQAVQAAAIFLPMRMVAIYLTCPCFPSLDRSAVAPLAPLAMENLDFVVSEGSVVRCSFQVSWGKRLEALQSTNWR